MRIEGNICAFSIIFMIHNTGHRWLNCMINKSHLINTYLLKYSIKHDLFAKMHHKYRKSPIFSREFTDFEHENKSTT